MIFAKSAFIGYETGERKGARDRYGNPCPYFRKTFEVSGKVRRATMYASAVGVFKAYINGREVSDDYMSPGWADYRTRIPYETFDVTQLIGEKNAVGIVAGDGWAVGKVGNRMLRCNYYDRIEVFCLIEIECEDGSGITVTTDGSWKARAGEILRTDNYMGEVVDLRRSLGNFSAYDYDDAGWDKVTARADKIALLDPAMVPPTRVKHRLTPAVIARENGRVLLDFGQNMSGVVRARLRGPRGGEAVFRYAEMLEGENELYLANLRSAEATDRVVLAGEGEEIFRPLFTFHGFRYMEAALGEGVELLSAVGEVMYSDLERTGEFSCSDETVNRLYRNVVWGQRDNFLNVPTDCPQRDERLGWTGDSQIFCGTAMYNMDCRDFFRKHLADIRDAQAGNGGVTGVAPVVPAADGVCYRGKVGAAGWGDAVAVIPFEHYLMYGDKRVLRENLPAVKRWLDYCLADSEGYIRSGEGHYGDWLNVGESIGHAVIATLYFAHSARLAADMCAILGDPEENACRELYRNIRAAFRARFLAADGTVEGDTQTGYLLAYAFGMADGKEVRDKLVAAIARRDYHLSTGFLGVKFLLPVLCELGETELAYRLLTCTTYPSWGYSVVNGATTVWERWNSYTREKGFEDPGMNSFNHYSLGSCGEWMFRYALGICPEIADGEGGFARLVVRPFIDPSGRITHAEGRYRSVRGEIAAAWRREGDRARYTVKIPEGMRARYDFGAYKKVEEAGAGVFDLWL